MYEIYNRPWRLSLFQINDPTNLLQVHQRPQPENANNSRTNKISIKRDIKFFVLFVFTCWQIFDFSNQDSNWKSTLSKYNGIAMFTWCIFINFLSKKKMWYEKPPFELVLYNLKLLKTRCCGQTFYCFLSHLKRKSWNRANCRSCLFFLSEIHLSEVSFSKKTFCLNWPVYVYRWDTEKVSYKK